MENQIRGKIMIKKKTSFVLFVLIAFILMGSNSCQRSEVKIPNPSGPSSFAILLNLKADPNVLIAGQDTREMSTITATLKEYDGTPIPGKTIVFEILDSSGFRVDFGYFEDNQFVISKTTNSSGSVTTNYYSPLSKEIWSNLTLYVRALVAWEGAQFIYDTVPIYIVRKNN